MKMISFTFDDGLDCHLDVAVPALEAHGFRGTFFVNPGAPSFEARSGAWRQAAARGHELANHTLRHPVWPRKGPVTGDNNIETYTLERMRMELEAASRILSGLDGKESRTFAYPCCNPILGRPGLVKRALWRAKLDRTRLMGAVLAHPWLDLGTREKSYEPLAGRMFLACRIGGERFSAAAGFPPPKSRVPCFMMDGKDRPRLERILRDFSREESGWLVFTAHGIGGGHALSCERSVFDWLLGAVRGQEIPVRTFGEAAQLIYGK